MSGNPWGGPESVSSTRREAGTCTYRDLDDDVFEYSMRNRRRGNVHIINNYLFDHLPSRDFSGVDRDSLLKALKFVGFKESDVKVRDNLTAQQMAELAKEASEEDFRRVGCLFFIVLTYGDTNKLYGKDGKHITYDQFLEPVRRASTGSLEGVPKLLLVQADPHPALEVGEDDHPIELTRPTRPPDLDSTLDHDAPEIYGSGKPFSTAQQSDFLTAYSTLPSTRGGSRFIQAFCEVMRRDGRRLEVTLILAITSRLMSYTPGTSMPNKGLCSPCVISKLTKGFFFS